MWEVVEAFLTGWLFSFQYEADADTVARVSAGLWCVPFYAIAVAVLLATLVAAGAVGSGNPGAGLLVLVAGICLTFIVQWPVTTFLLPEVTGPSSEEWSDHAKGAFAVLATMSRFVWLPVSAMGLGALCGTTRQRLALVGGVFTGYFLCAGFGHADGGSPEWIGVPLAWGLTALGFVSGIRAAEIEAVPAGVLWGAVAFGIALSPFVMFKFPVEWIATSDGFTTMLVTWLYHGVYGPLGVLVFWFIAVCTAIGGGGPERD
jgi:hypothetical protein